MIALASYPRSGNTWMRYLIEYCTSRPVDSVAHDKFSWRIRTSGDPIMTKTHYPDARNFTRAVWIVRNPFDAIVSYYHYRKDFDKVTNLEMTDHVYQAASEWKRHTEFWKKFPDRVMIAYEEMLRDCYGSLEVVFKFLGLLIPENKVHAAIESSNVDQMRARLGNKFMRRARAGYGIEALNYDQMCHIRKVCGPAARECGYSL